LTTAFLPLPCEQISTMNQLLRLGGSSERFPQSAFVGSGGF
jgi:hypothetical protein